MSQSAEWCPTRFDQFALLQRGQDLPKTQFQLGEVPVAGSAGVIGFHNEANVKGPGVTVGRSGSCGTIRFYQTDFFAHNTALYVRDFFGNHPLYVAFFLEHFKPSRFKSGVSVPTLDRNQFRNEIVAVPEAGEQLQIARVLATVQRAIEQQQAIIATTRELKRSLMHKLFTEGLGGETQKPTEIGLVPESWKVRRIGEIAALKSGGTPSRSNESFWIGGTIPWVKTGEVDYCVINDTEEKITQAGLDGSSAKIFPAGTLLMAMYGQGITRGKVGILGIDAATNQACAAFFPNEEVRAGFLYQLFSFKYDYIRNLGHGANQKNLSADILKTVQIAYPKDTDEQDEIVSTLSILDDKLALAGRKRSHFEDLFKILLYKLMTAQLRINELDLDALGVPALD